jgi:nitrite reductase/ring-hydroxylating ferredoxin subunit
MNEMYRVCALDELPDPGSREFQWGEGDWPLEMFIVRQGDSAFGYLNRCPHAGHPLNWQTDQFLSKENDLILCQSHGARFTISDGSCVLGPCPGASLRSIKMVIQNGDIVVAIDDLKALQAETGY